jgi:hypothetical protein
VLPATLSLAKTRSLSDSARRGGFASPRHKALHKGGRNIRADKALDLVRGDVIDCHIDRLPNLGIRIV